MGLFGAKAPTEPILEKNSVIIHYLHFCAISDIFVIYLSKRNHFYNLRAYFEHYAKKTNKGRVFRNHESLMHRNLGKKSETWNLHE